MRNDSRRFPERCLFVAVAATLIVLLAGALVVASDEPPAPAPPAPAPTSPAPAPPTSAPTSPAPPPQPADQGVAPGTLLSGRLLTGKISGTVSDTAKRPLAGVMVKLGSRQDPGLLRVTSTDRKGQYLFKDLAAGAYDVRVEADGFRAGAKERVDVRPPFQNIVDVPLLRTDEYLPGSAGVAEKAMEDAAARAAATKGGAPGTAPADPGAKPVVPPVAVRGRFVDAAGRPVTEVPVLLAGTEGGLLYQGFSDDDGRFLIESVVPGRYRIRVRSLGHVPIDLRSVEVLPESGLNLSLALVDYALNDHGQMEAQPPPEMPRPLTAPKAPAPPAPAPPANPPPANAVPPADTAPPDSEPPPDGRSPDSAPPDSPPPPDNPPKPPGR
jgi:protocatechuate 3,4-dioxygenase beta subunit